MNKYQEVNGTCYSITTKKEVIDILENVRKNKIRIVLDYGNVSTGESWGEIYDITGVVSRSTGDKKIPILLYNSKSIGGPSILDKCIIGIKESKGKKILYSLNKK